jgi:hypothetical protein
MTQAILVIYLLFEIKCLDVVKGSASHNTFRGTMGEHLCLIVCMKP